ncbi:MAG TPA: hypothetical protein VFQ50_09195 [Flavobacterium sp.]|nr:hypothetical protein [Flavobacterium sp.]
MKKPITPMVHGIMDYAMGATLLALPAMMGADGALTKTYGAVGLGILSQNALTDSPCGIRKSISLKQHKMADTGILAAVALSTFSKAIRNDKKMLGFHVGLLTMLTAQYLLTDFDGNSNSGTKRPSKRKGSMN